MSVDEDLHTKITKDNYSHRRVIEVEIGATGEHKETFEELREAVKEVLDK